VPLLKLFLSPVVAVVAEFAAFFRRSFREDQKQGLCDCIVSISVRVGRRSRREFSYENVSVLTRSPVVAASSELLPKTCGFQRKSLRLSGRKNVLPVALQNVNVFVSFVAGVGS